MAHRPLGLLFAVLGLALCASCKDLPGTVKDTDTTDVSDTTDVEGDADADSDADTDTPPIADADHDGSPDDVDCDDGDPAVFPGAPDACGDDRVTDCDRTSDDGLVSIVGGATFDALQDALDAAATGDELVVCPGAYQGPFAAAVAVSIASHGGRDATTLIGGAGPVIQVAGGSALTGLTVRDGNAQNRGGGIQVASPGDLIVDDCVITHNRAGTGGGISLVPGSTAAITDSVVSDNVADIGGGIYCESCTVDLTGSVVEGNSAGEGGGLYLAGELTGGAVQTNRAESGGGYYYEEDSIGGGLFAEGDLTVTGTTFSANTGPVGAGLVLFDGSFVLTDVAVHDNVGGNFSSGAGIYASFADVVLAGTTEVYANHAEYNGGGVALTYGTLVGGTIRDNLSDVFGGGLYLYAAELEGVTVIGNQAGDGGGVRVGGDTSLVGCAVADNVATRTGGGIVAPYDDDDDEIDTDTDTGTGTRLYGYGSDVLHLEDTAVTGNVASRGGGVFSWVDVEVFGGEVTDNVADDDGAGLVMNNDPLTVQDAVIARNVGAQGGGVALGVGSTVSSTASDWGSGADDNAPDDVWLGLSGVSGFGPGATFACDNDGCTPTP